MTSRNDRLRQDLRMFLLFTALFLTTGVAPAAVLGRFPLRPIDYVIGICFGLQVSLGLRSVVPMAAAVAVAYSAVYGVIVSTALACVYAVACFAGLSITSRFAGDDRWLCTPRSARTVISGAAAAFVFSGFAVGYLLQPSIEGRSAHALTTDWLVMLRATAREFAGAVALAPLVLLRFSHYVRRIAGLPADMRSVAPTETLHFGESLLVSALSILAFGVAVVCRREYGIDVVLLGFAPLAVAAMFRGIDAAAASIAFTAVGGSALWSFAGWNTVLSLEDLRLAIVTSSITALMIAAYSEQRRDISKIVEARIRELRELTSATEEEREDERTRLAREAHDELGQHLTGLKMSLKMLATRPPPDALSQLSTLAGDTDAVLAHAERIGSELSPEIMGPAQPLAQVISSLAREYEDRFGFRCTVESSFSWFPEPRVGHAVRQIVREALTNVARHSGATGAVIRILAIDGCPRIEVEDNGRGFRTGHGVPSPGIGIIGMKERASLLGANLSVTSAPNCGVSVALQIVQPEPESAQAGSHP